MAHHLRSPFREEPADRFAVGDVGFDKARGARDEVTEAGGEIVQDRDLVAQLDEAIRHVRADETRTAGHQYAHDDLPGSRLWRSCSARMRHLAAALVAQAPHP